jgi:hypothetical protein
MSDCDTVDSDPEQVPPAWALVLLALQQTEGWQSRQDIEDHIYVEIGVAVCPRTLRRALRNVRDWDGVQTRYRNINGSEAREYRRT